MSAASIDIIFHLGDRIDDKQFRLRAIRSQLILTPGASVMIHFTCDRCKRVIDSEQELRYIVRMEIEAVMDPIHDDEPQDDRDHLHEIEEILERMDDCEDATLNDDIYHKRRYDLCPSCFRKFNANPLSPSEKKPQLGFSHN